MFAKSFISAVVLLAVSTPAVLSKPVPVQAGRGAAKRYDVGYSLNNYGGYSVLSNFDNFYGYDNFDSSLNVQTVVQQDEVVCQSETIVIVQQRLAILQEIAKQIITEQICEVEVQTIVINQFSSVWDSFYDYVTRHSSGYVGYDSSITSQYGSIYGSDGSLTSNDLGFSGSSIGSNLVVPSGSNWNSQTSPSSVASAIQAASSASAASASTSNDIISNLV